MALGSALKGGDNDILALYEACGRTSTSYMSLSHGLEYIRFGNDGFVAFKDNLGVRVVPGDPIAMPGGLERIAAEVRRGTPVGWHVVLFACDDTTRRVFEQHGFSSLYIGSEPVVDIDTFSLAGRRNRGFRGSINRAKRMGLTMTEYRPASGRDGPIEDGIRHVSTEWCRTKGTPELDFLVGHLDFEETYGKRYFLCWRDDEPVAYVLLYPIPATGDVYLDHMRRLPGSPKECLDFTLCETIGLLGSEGVGKLYMGVCPFSRMMDVENGNPTYVSALFKMLQRPFGVLYPAEGEYMYKKKYATSWEPRYMCSFPRVSARGLLAILDCFCPGGVPAIVSHKMKRLITGRSARAP